jgi:2-methylcitrate dehydratase PrpD
MTHTSPPATEPATRLLAEALATARYEDLGAETIEHARRAVIDWLGSALAGAVEPAARMAQRVVAGLGASSDATVFAAGRSSSAGAGLANGVATHILELDDVHKGSTLHAAAPVIPAALAVAEREHSTGHEFLLSVVVGYDAALRIGEAVNPNHYRFWHPTGTAATFGAAAAAASLLRLTPTQTIDALGSAGTQAAGLWEFNADGAMSKHLHPGKAAFNGVLAADLARAGFTGATRILEGDRGFFRATSASYDADRVTDRLGQEWKIGENCYKLHSCCGHTHTAIDVAVEMRAARNWSHGEAPHHIAEITIETYGPGFEVVKQQNPRTPYQAKFSLAYCVAAALCEGLVELEQFSPDRFGPVGVCDPSIVALLARTRVVVADDLTAKYPAAWPARLAITLADGTVLRGASDFPRGNPENPVTTTELERKLVALVSARLGPELARRALGAARAVGERSDMAEAFREFGVVEVA